MKPYLSAALIITSVIFISLMLVSEIKDGFVSASMAEIWDSLPTVGSDIDPFYVPNISIIDASSEHSSSSIIIVATLASYSEKAEIVEMRVSSVPDGEFSEKSETRVISEGDNRISMFLEDDITDPGFAVNIGLYAQNGRLIDEKVVESEMQYIPLNEFSACSSAEYCRKNGLGNYCWGNVLGEYQCHEECARLLSYAPVIENCCQEICTIMMKNGMCMCKM